MRILVFGDSIAQGYHDLEMGGWVNRLFVDILKEKARNTTHTTELFNVSVSGDTIQNVIDRFPVEAEARQWGDDPFKFIFALGFNDARVDNGVPFSSTDSFMRQLQVLYDLTQPFKGEVLFVGPSSANEAESRPWTFNSGSDDITWTNERLQQFDATLRAFAKSKDTGYVGVFETFMKQGSVRLHADGIHPNAEGHKLIYELVKPHVIVAGMR
jgi:lysophospholipase L1-like esterase